MISQEDMQALESYEYSFKTAIENNFARHFGSKQYAALKEIYKHITGKYPTTNFSCGYCAIGFIKQLGKLYFDEKARLEAEKVQTELEPETVTDSVPKKKGGRSKKQATNNEQK